jgi:sulfur-carrier protein adenylyltransferase/sulfurtransferase
MLASISASELAELLKRSPDQVLLLDVREPDEREAARIEPSLHIPMGEVSQRIGEIPKDRRLVVYCHHGTRSMMVGVYLAGQGFANVENLSGGIDGWSKDVDPSVPRY